MSQQSLASKTITKRNVAQSSIIFSVVVTLVTLGFIGGAAFLDISNENDIANKEREELVKELANDNESKSLNQQDQLIERANHLVKAMDDKVKEIKRLEKQVKEADKRVDQLALRQQEIQILNDQKHLEYLSNDVQQIGNNSLPVNSNSELKYEWTLNEYYRHHLIANGRAEFNIAWVFKARSDMQPTYGMNAQYLESQNTDLMMKQL